MSQYLHGCGGCRSPIKSNFSNQAGFTCFRLMIGLVVLSFLMGLGMKIVKPCRSRADIVQIRHDIRKFQEAMILFHAEYERIPTLQDLVGSYLKGLRNLDFVVVDATQPGSLGFDDEDDRLEEKLLKAVRLIEEENVAPLPSRWLIVTKADLKPGAKMVFAVDDAIPVIVPGDGHPVEKTQEVAGL